MANEPAMNVDQIRKDLLLKKEVIYLDNAAASVMPRQVVSEIAQYLTRTATEGIYQKEFRRQTYARIEAARIAGAEFIGATSSEVALVGNGSEAISCIAQGLNWRSGDEVIISNCEMTSNIAPWLSLQEAGRVRLRMVDVDENGLVSVDCLASMITPRTRLISITHLSNAIGVIQPIAHICDLARDKGIFTLINASQSLGMIPIDVRELGCDFLAACGRKALRGPEGSGLLYVREEHIPMMSPPLLGWWNGGIDEAKQTLVLPQTAKRFEAGCPNTPSIIGLGVALHYAMDVGIKAIYERVRGLTEYAIGQILTLPDAQFYGPAVPDQRLAVIPLNLGIHDADAIVTYLDERSIIAEAGHFMATSVMRRFNIKKMLRLSLHYFNTPEEIDSCISELRNYLKNS